MPVPVFLQGLLFLMSREEPRPVSNWSAVLSAWSSWCSSTGLSQLEAALSYVTSDDRFETAIVGVQTADQLSGILRARDVRVGSPLPDFEVIDLDLIEPSRWRLQ